MNGLKGRNKVKRKEWKALFDKLTSERKRIVSASLLVHGIKPCEPRRGHPPPRAQNFEIGGLPVPALFSLRGKANLPSFDHMLTPQNIALNMSTMYSGS